jgi:ubiquinone/menaquinone biosynthesis C-methylase UbiE
MWYWYVSTVDKKAEVTYMNFGYSKDNQKLKLDEKDEKDRYSAQLYHHVATGVDIKDKDILEIGSGRGGGLSFVNRYLSPKTATGVDLNSKAVEFCNKHYTDKNIEFYQSNAQELSFKENSFDVVINLESSHRYSKMDKFLAEVHRVLRPGGVFLFSDFRDDTEFEDLNKQLNNCELTLISDEDITPNVVEALQLSTKEREELIRKIAPKIFHKFGKTFAATEGSSTYDKFKTRKFEYFFKIMTKQEA